MRVINSKKKQIRWGVMAVATLFISLSVLSGCGGGHWREASRESANLAPQPADEPRAVVQAYAAKVWGWRGWFADHTWVATKAAGAQQWTVYEVIGWRLRRGGSAVRIANDVPDRKWFGNTPKLLVDIRGDNATDLIGKIADAANTYPYPDSYSAFPGPNSNTFTAWIAQQVPEMNLILPARAIGKNYQ